MENIKEQLEHSKQMLREKLNEHSIKYLMDMLREEFPFKPRYWYEGFETKEEIIDKLIESENFQIN